MKEKKNLNKQAIIFHPDKNTTCEEDATSKFQKLQNLCSKENDYKPAPEQAPPVQAPAPEPEPPAEPTPEPAPAEPAPEPTLTPTESEAQGVAEAEASAEAVLVPDPETEVNINNCLAELKKCRVDKEEAFQRILTKIHQILTRP